MKMCLLSLMSAIFLITILSTSVMGANPINVTLNGKHLQFNVPPVLEKGRVLVPLRVIFESLGATVDWDGTTNTAVAIKGNDTVKLTIGKKTAYRNNVSVELDVPAKVVNGRTLVPVRFVSEALKERVYWFAESDKRRTVLIFSQHILTQDLNRLAQVVEQTNYQNLESARELVIKNNGLWRYLLLTKEHWMVDDILLYDTMNLHNIWFPEGEATRFMARFVNRPNSLDQSPNEQTDSTILDMVAFVDLSGNEPLLVWLAYLGKLNKKSIIFKDELIA